jgi:hypothetical protein
MRGILAMSKTYPSVYRDKIAEVLLDLIWKAKLRNMRKKLALHRRQLYMHYYGASLRSLHNLAKESKNV